MIFDFDLIVTGLESKAFIILSVQFVFLLTWLGLYYLYTSVVQNTELNLSLILLVVCLPNFAFLDPM